MQPQNSAKNCDYNRKILPKIAITTAKFCRKLRLQPLQQGTPRLSETLVRKDFLRLSDGQHGGHAHKARR